MRFDGKSGVDGCDPDKYLAQYNAAGGNINALRRAQYAKSRERINAQKRAAYAARVAKMSESGIINPDNRPGGESDVQLIGKIDVSIYRCVTQDITTDEVVITNERIQHIEERHPGHFERIRPYLSEIIANPDYILENALNTCLLLKCIEDGDLRIQTVLRLHTSTDSNGFKNSIISAWCIREKEYHRLLRNKNILYKLE